jgi:hypothetical protein
MKRIHKPMPPEYRCWSGIKARCFRPSCKEYVLYGARGITMCERWRSSFSAFIEDMGLRPSPQHSIDRIDVNGNYEPGNCRLATSLEQGRNKRNSKFVEFNGVKKTVSEWAEFIGVSNGTLHMRFKMGWSVERALSRPVTPGMILSAGERRRGRVKLNEEIVKSIHASELESSSAIARRLGVHKTTVQAIRNGETWKYLWPGNATA